MIAKMQNKYSKSNQTSVVEGMLIGKEGAEAGGIKSAWAMRECQRSYNTRKGARYPGE